MVNEWYTLKVLVACEESGVVREAFKKKGHYSVSCDFLPSSIEGDHYQGDVLDIIHDGWDLMIAHPPCTFLCLSGARWVYDPRYPDRKEDREKAYQFVLELINAPIDKIAIENPIGYLSSRWRKPDQIIKPYMFGDNSTKSTCLWLKNLSKLSPTDVIVPDKHISKKGIIYDKWWFDTCLIQDHEERRKARSKTFQGIADAMADQWGS